MSNRYIAVVSDQHITEPGSRLGTINTNRYSEQLFDELQSLTLPHAVVCLGDLADTAHNPERGRALGSPESYANAKELASGLRRPILTVAGNHDDPALMQEYFPSHWSSTESKLSHYSFHGIDLIALDARTGPEATGFLPNETIDELDVTLSRSNRALIFSHFPLTDFDNDMVRRDLSVTNRDKIRPVLERHKGKIAGCYNGHLHTPLGGSLAGIPSTSVLSSSFGFNLRPHTDAQLAVRESPRGYLMLSIDTDSSVTHWWQFLSDTGDTYEKSA